MGSAMYLTNADKKSKVKFRLVLGDKLFFGNPQSFMISISIYVVLTYYMICDLI